MAGSAGEVEDAGVGDVRGDGFAEVVGFEDAGREGFHAGVGGADGVVLGWRHVGGMWV